MSALFNDVKLPRGTIKWPLVAHTVTMFSILTVVTAIYLEVQSFANIGDRKSPGGDRHTSLLAPQKHEKRHKCASQSSRLVQSHRHLAYRVLCRLLCYPRTIHGAVGRT